jgi:hypothetical protein
MLRIRRPGVVIVSGDISKCVIGHIVDFVSLNKKKKKKRMPVRRWNSDSTCYHSEALRLKEGRLFMLEVVIGRVVDLLMV